ASALLPFGPARDATMRFTIEDGLNPRPLLAIAMAVVGVGIGVAIAIRRTARAALLAALGLTILYIVLGTIMAPEVWLDQRGLLMREVPLLALTLVALAILDER